MQKSERSYVTQRLFVTPESGQKNAQTSASTTGFREKSSGLSPENAAGPTVAGVAFDL